MRGVIWVVGDVHGCVRAFERVVREIRLDPGRDALWSAGDLVNTGPHSLETLRLWRDLGGRAVLGNHDIYALRAFAGAVPRHDDRLDGLFAAPDAGELLAHLRAQPLFVRLGPEVVLVHAGLHPRWDDPEKLLTTTGPHDDAWLAREETTFATRVRCCTEDGTRTKHVGPPAECPPPFRAWDAFYRGNDLVVHGHWAWRGYHRSGRVLGLDSGCVYGGELTAWCVEEDRVVRTEGGLT